VKFKYPSAACFFDNVTWK